MLDVLGLTFDEVRAALQTPPHRVKELRADYKRLHRGEVGENSLRVGVLPVVRRAKEGELTKFIQRCPDGLETESVVVPMRGYTRTWKTLCVSSQVGCARGCAFCETARLGLLRNLSCAEIVGQVVAARREHGDELRNVVFMGMGEPFDNFDAVVHAIRVITDRSGLSLGLRRIAVSTAGVTAGIRRLAAVGWKRLDLAISLNAPNDEIRARIMPIARVEPMSALLEALKAYPLRNCQFFMIEYVLIPGLNDAREHARELAEYLRPLACIVNVIPYNPRHDSPWDAPTEESVLRFVSWLDEAGQPVKRRITKGRTLMAGCGQLGNRALARNTNPPVDRADTGCPESPLIIDEPHRGRVDGTW